MLASQSQIVAICKGVEIMLNALCFFINYWSAKLYINNQKKTPEFREFFLPKFRDTISSELVNGNRD